MSLGAKDIEHMEGKTKHVLLRVGQRLRYLGLQDANLRWRTECWCPWLGTDKEDGQNEVI
jgi:hypothetical protein